MSWIGIGNTIFRMGGGGVSWVPYYTPTTIVDADSNVYTSVVIGTERWLVENLKTTKYNDGSAIPTGLSNANWALEDGSAGHDGSYAHPNNDAANDADYGLLYNWHAVNNAKGIAPTGYRVATQADFAALSTYLGGLTGLGNKLKEHGSSYWGGTITNSSNISGLGMRGSGYRAETGIGAGFKTLNILWTSDSQASPEAYYLINNSADVGHLGYDKRYGLSIRCVATDVAVQRFSDDSATSIFAPDTAHGEQTVLLSDDGSQIDMWFVKGVQINYSYSTDGKTFAAPQATDITNDYKRCHILKEGSTYYMFATGVSDTIMRLFTSTNKINFTDQGQVLTVGGAGAWDESGIGNSFVWKEGSTWYMIYDGLGVSGRWYEGLATAPAVTGPWTKYVSNPVINPILGAGNPEMIRSNNQIVKGGNRYYLFFHSDLTGILQRAYSTDLHNWTFEGYLSYKKENGLGMWFFADCGLIEFNGKCYLYYGPTDQTSVAHINVSIDNLAALELLKYAP